MQGRNKARRRLGQETSLTPSCSNLRSFGSKYNVLKEVLMTLLWLFGPRSDSAPGELCLLSPLVTPLVMCNKNRKIFRKQNKFSSPNLMNFYFINICNFRTQYAMLCSCTNCQQRLLTAFPVSSCSFCVTSMPAPHVFRRGPVFVLLKSKTFPTFNKLLI